MFFYMQWMNYLFGWEYASFVFGFSRKVARIRKGPDGERYCYYLGYIILEGDSEWFQLF